MYRGCYFELNIHICIQMFEIPAPNFAANEVRPINECVYIYVCHIRIKQMQNTNIQRFDELRMCSTHAEFVESLAQHRMCGWDTFGKCLVIGLVCQMLQCFPSLVGKLRQIKEANVVEFFPVHTFVDTLLLIFK